MSLFVIMESDVFCETNVPIAIAHSEQLANDYLEHHEEGYGINRTVVEIYPSHIIKEHVND